MMKLNMIVKGPLTKYTDGQTELEVELEPGATVYDLLKKYSLHQSSYSIVAVNGEKVYPSRELSDGDQVKVFPHVAGGSV